MQVFRETGAYLKGHFRLTSGLHSNEYLQCAQVLQYPHLAERFGRELAARLPACDVVVSPAIGGLPIGHEVARAKGARFIFTERDASGKMILRRGFSLRPGEKALVIEDVVTTGGTTREVIDVATAAGRAAFWQPAPSSTAAAGASIWACRAWRWRRSMWSPIRPTSAPCARRAFRWRSPARATLRNAPHPHDRQLRRD